ncbi:hypothetical protein MUP65_02065 [Patescibacteria group bacterium]|nr:hypothetical protein [Patescibacteria group bacterium]
METADLTVKDQPKVVVVGGEGFWGKRIGWAFKSMGFKQVESLGREKKNLAQRCRAAEIIVSVVGKAGLITDKLVKSGAVLIDVGYQFVAGQPKGDIDFESVNGRASFVTPVPGGIGPLSVAYLFTNFLQSLEEADNDQSES